MLDIMYKVAWILIFWTLLGTFILVQELRKAEIGDSIFSVDKKGAYIRIFFWPFFLWR